MGHWIPTGRGFRFEPDTDEYRCRIDNSDHEDDDADVPTLYDDPVPDWNNYVTLNLDDELHVGHRRCDTGGA
jgi:hypothetical protein